MDNKKLHQIFKQIENTSSRNEKTQILKENINNPILSDFLKIVYNPFKTYNIKNVDLPNVQGEKTLETHFDEVVSAFDNLNDLLLTGNNARNHFNDLLMGFIEQDQKIILSALKRDLKIGISEKTINDAFKKEKGKQIPTFGCALASEYKGNVNLDKDGPWYVSRKLDGCRCLAVIDKQGKVSLLSRNGKPFQTLDKVKDSLESVVQTNPHLKDHVLDGEITILDPQGNESFKSIMTEITRKDHTIDSPMYQIFDIIPSDEFFGSKQTKGLSFPTRLNTLRSTFSTTHNPDAPCLTLLNQIKVSTQEQLDTLIAATPSHWEGLMLKNSRPYQTKRTKDLQKIKSFKDQEFKVIAAENTSMTFQTPSGTETLDNVLKAIVILNKGTKVSVGSGFSKEQRILFGKHPNLILNKIVTVKYFEETPDHSLRFPTLKAIHGTERTL